MTNIIQAGRKTPFTRFNRLSNGLYNRFDNRVEQTVCLFNTVVKQWLFVQHGCQTGCTTRFDNRVEWTATVRSTGCQTGLYNRMYTWYSRLSNGLSVWQPVECLYTRYNRLSDRFDNRLYRVNGSKPTTLKNCKGANKQRSSTTVQQQWR